MNESLVSLSEVIGIVLKSERDGEHLTPNQVIVKLLSHFKPERSKLLELLPFLEEAEDSHGHSCK